MTHLKKSLALLLAIVMIFSSMSVAASAAAVGEPDAGDESATFTVKFFRDKNRGKTDENGNPLPIEWVETTKAAPGEYVNARVYLSTNFATGSNVATAFLFDTDFFEAIKGSKDADDLKNPTLLPQGTPGMRSDDTDQKNYVAIASGGVQYSGALTSRKIYRSDATGFSQIRYLISQGYLDAADFAGRELICSTVEFNRTIFPETIILTDSDINNWYDEFYFTVRSNSTTKTIGEIGEAEVPAQLRGSIELTEMNVGSMLVDVPKGKYGVTPNNLRTLGDGWEISDDNFISTEGWITTTGEVLLDANGGSFAGDATTAEIKGIIEESIETAVSEKEKDVSRPGFKLIGWSTVKTSKGAPLTEQILNEIGFSKMTDAQIAELGWKLTENNIGFLDKTAFPDAKAGDVLTEEMVAALDLKNKTVTDLQGYGFNVTTGVLDALKVDEANTDFNHDGYTLYALWDNSGRAEYLVETYLMDTNGSYPTVPTQTDSFYAEAGTLVPLQAVAREGFTLDTQKSSESVIVEADPENPSVLKAYYARNQYKLTYNYEDNEGKHTETELVYYDEPIDEFDSLPTSNFTLTITDGEGNPIGTMPEKMPAHDIVADVHIQIVYLFDAGEGATFSNGDRTMTFVYKFGQATDIPEKPTKPGHEFVDWDKDIPATATGNMTFKAEFNPLGAVDEYYTVTFYGYDEEGKLEVIESTDGYGYGDEFEAVDLPEGYLDTVWKLKGDESNTPVSFPYPITGNTEFEPVSEDTNV